MSAELLQHPHHAMPAAGVEANAGEAHSCDFQASKLGCPHFAGAGDIQAVMAIAGVDDFEQPQ